MNDFLEELQVAGLPDSLDRCIAYWHSEPADHAVAGIRLNAIALELAWRNYSLWHEEDKARRDDVDDSVIASVKRRIDRINQERNDCIEQLDSVILEYVERNRKPVAADETNSETPGSIVDRISIMSLKIWHMAEDAARTDITADHQERSVQRLAVLREQRDDLWQAVQRLLADYLTGHKRMKLYRQFKMYNDPTLNPELYRRKLHGA
jgi:hypothetical protein